jgi:signal transduction histidine kinase
VGISLPSSAEEDQLYIDLGDSPIYVKNGFEPAYVSFTDPNITDWGLELPASYEGSVIMSQLPRTNPVQSTGWSPWRDRPADEFTVMIPFTLNDDQLSVLFDRNDPVVPGVFLAGIGDNWEIYINGEMVYHRVFMDSDGVITSHRAQRSVFFPLNRTLLYAGDNMMVIHLYGAWDSINTGLFYSSPYYIGNYTAIMNRALDYQTMTFCTVFLFLSLYHALLYFLRRRNSHNLIYGALSALAAVYFTARSSAIYQFVEDTGITIRIEYTSLFLALFVLAAFLEALNRQRLRSITVAYGAFCGLFIVAQFIFSLDFAEDLFLIGKIVGSLFLIYVVAYDVIYAFFHEVGERQRTELLDGRKPALGVTIAKSLKDTVLGNISVFVFLMMCTAIFDLLDSQFWHTNLMLMRYGFFMLTLLMAFTLARSYASSFESTAQMNEALDRTVHQRTAELEQQVLLAQEASRAKSDFLATMSHEIRTPLNAVIGMTAIGAMSQESQRKDYAFERIQEASEHLLGVINDILDMSKIEAGKLELSNVAFVTRDVVARVANVMRFRTNEKSQDLRIHIADDVPVSLYGDDRRLAQVITNLIGNAVKFTPEKGCIALEVYLEEEVNDLCTLRFLVIDTGIGISEEQQTRLFQSFQQADSSTTRSYGGTGLGLALSKRMVELMGGEIGVTSQLGKGSTFSFTVRLPRASLDALAAEARVAVAELQNGEFAGFTILLVEDVAVNREIVHVLLEASQVRIDDAVNGQEAVRMFEANPELYDLVLMDVQMPVMDGYDATRQIRGSAHARGAYLPIIAMTANVFREDVEYALAVGMNAHLSKPIEINDMVVLLREYLTPRD